MIGDILKKIGDMLRDYTITQDFGCTGVVEEPRLGTCAHFHWGVDFAAPSGTALYSPVQGTITLAGVHGGYGNTVKISGSNGFSVLLGHLSQINVSQGQIVHIGDKLGYSGSTGASTGPHIHLEVRDPHDNPVDIQQGFRKGAWGKIWQSMRNVFRWVSLVPGTSTEIFTTALPVYDSQTGRPYYYQPGTISDYGTIPGDVQPPVPIGTQPPGTIGDSRPPPGTTVPPQQSVLFTIPTPWGIISVPNPLPVIFADYLNSAGPATIVMLLGLALGLAGLRQLGKEKPVQAVTNLTVTPAIETTKQTLNAGKKAAMTLVR